MVGLRKMKYGPILVGMSVVAACATTKNDVDDSNQTEDRQAEIANEVYHDTSMPLRMMQPAKRSAPVVHEVKRLPRPGHPAPGQADEDEVPLMLQDLEVFDFAPTPLANFDGIGNGVGGFTVNSAPPDTNGDVGPNHYVQIVNSDLAVFNKTTGAIIWGPNPTNTLWAGFGGLCQTDNDGDGVVLYDPIADRWIVSQFAVSGAG